MTQIVCRNLEVGYSGHTVLRAPDFAVHAGDFLCIVGENGSGKSTLMRTLLGLQAPTGGTLRYDDDIAPSCIGYLPQQTEIQRDFPASVREIVRSGFDGHRGWRPFYTRKQKHKAEKLMQNLGLTELAQRSYRTLSGGQQQRVLLARALCAARRALLLDEPVTGLDPRAAAHMYRILGSLHKHGVTILMITHDVRPALALADHVLDVGKTPFYGTAADYLQSAAGRRFAPQEGGAV